MLFTFNLKSIKSYKVKLKKKTSHDLNNLTIIS